ncbi:hypothetical protein BVG79_01085 [Ketogulonicigenium robustum]|uniref:Uncharacterized protein n=1 Tax=Ketogulonicigenium robustum TaxID=92947 RepID=A0A1W6NZ35_9RHOB|nr:hypothetical protein [Ketogulonicigenium robustum]ARO14431.1 hypothetical protein BVG79_01085 [Ketogulonicigenium robustum]
MAVVEFVGNSGRDRDNIAANTSRLVNCYLEETTGGKWAFKSVLGSKPHAAMAGVFVRAMAEVGGLIYVVCGGALWTVDAAGSVVRLADIPDSDQTSISSNNGAITIAAGGEYFLWDGSTLTTPSGGAFEDVSSVEFVDYYTMMTEAGGRRIQWTAQAAPETLNGLYFATAEGRDDLIVRGVTLGSLFVVFKAASHELWYNTGGAGAQAFARVTGGVRDVGLAGYDLIAKLPSSGSGQAAFVGSDGRLYLFTGGTANAVSTRPVETAIAQCEALSVLAYEDEGHTFVALVFRDEVAWVYDLTTGLWHERAEGADQRPWSARRSVKLGRKWYVGQNGGQIVELVRSNRDGVTPLFREATSSTLTMDGQRFLTRELEFFPRQGISSADVQLSLSRDGGMTWTRDKPRPMGGQGNYGKRLIWRNLGQARSLTARIRWTNPEDVSFSAEARVVVG